MKVSASIYAGKGKDLPSLVKQLDQYKIDYFHIDCMDDESVFEDIARIREISATPIDLHIISKQPERFYSLIKQHEIEMATFQYEELNGKLDLPDDLPGQIGLAITSGTDIDVFDEYAEQMDFILMMTTEPGKSGGTFQKTNFKRIRAFSERHPGKLIHVDGGVNDEVSFILRTLGVHSIVSGSFLVNHENVGNAVYELKAQHTVSHYQLQDFMIDYENLPVLEESSCSISNILQAIEDGGMGFCAIVDKQQQLKGIVSNADIRRALLKHLDDLNAVQVGQLINPKPKTILNTATIGDMLKLVNHLSFIILFLPVVDSQNKLCGAVTFNQLIKGES